MHLQNAEGRRHEMAVAQMDRYDLGVIGGGMGGLRATNEAAKLGARVALIERGKLGGMSA